MNSQPQPPPLAVPRDRSATPLLNTRFLDWEGTARVLPFAIPGHVIKSRIVTCDRVAQAPHCFTRTGLLNPHGDKTQVPRHHCTAACAEQLGNPHQNTATPKAGAYETRDL